MKIHYIYAHPNPDSFNRMLKDHALTILTRLNHETLLSDLYAEQFTSTASWHDFDIPKNELNSQYFLAQQEAYNKHRLASDINNEIQKIREADHLIFQFPLWWFSVPAILKGWFDRVLVKGFAYDAGKVFGDGLLKGKKASLILSTQSPEPAFKSDGVHGTTIDAFLLPIHHTLRFVGITSTSPFVTYGAFNLNNDQEKEIINRLDTYLNSL